jgi:hypothetical protein
MRAIKRNQTVESINEELQALLVSNYLPGSAKEAAIAVLADPRFTKAVEDARKDLGVEILDFSEAVSFINAEDLYKSIETWLQENSPEKNLQDVINICERVVEEVGLSWGWLDFTMGIIVFNEPLVNLLKLIQPEPMMEVQELSGDGNQLILNIQKGISSKEYHNAWKVLKTFLAEPSTYEIKETKLKNRIYLDYLDGLTPGEIAKKYYPKEFKEDYQYITDRIKKIVKRFKTVKTRDYRRRPR